MFSKILAMVLVLSLMLSAFPSLSVFAQEVSSEEKLTEKGELWQPETNSNALNFEGDLSLEELETAKLADEDMPEIVGQDNIEEKGHVNRLWEQEEDLNSIVFQNRDGTKTMYYYNYPVKYKDANGKIKDKSNKISQTSSGDFTNAENDINTYFPKKLNKNKGVVLKFDNHTVEMAPDIKGNSGASRQTGHNKYFDPTEYVQYPDVFDDGISLRYTPTFEGYKEDIVLSEYTGINEFSFRLYTDGLSLAMNEDGSYYLIDPLSGEIKTQIGDLVVYDSKPFDVPDEILNESVSNPTEEDYAKKEATLKELIESVPIESSTTEEQPGSLNTYSHQYRVETVKQDNEYLITIVVDEDYLTDSERVYPVYVDPTISVSGSGTSKTIQDAPIYANKPSTTSGGNTYNVVGYQGSTYGVGRTLMKFPGLSSNSTYANLPTNQITSLQLHIYEGSGSTNNACIDLWQYNGTSWTESTARCNNVGWDSYSNNFTWNYINCSGWQTFNLTSMVATWKGSSSALDKGIMLKNYTSESSSGYSKHFLSTESGYQPYLTFNYTSSISYTTLTNGNSVSGNIEQGGEYWYKFTANECSDYTFSTTGSTDTYGELYQGTTLIQSNDDEGSGTNFSITYLLVAGAEYRLKVRGYSSTTSGSYSVKAESDYTGYAVYRDLAPPMGWVSGDWHSGLLVEKNKNVSQPIIHVSGLTDVLKYSSWSGFVDGGDFDGVYRPNQTLTASDKQSIAALARELETYDIDYILTHQMRATVWPDASKIEPEDIVELRCDGFVEYCYEYNGIRIFGDDEHWDISAASAENIAHHSISNVTPKIQAEDYMILVRSTY